MSYIIPEHRQGEPARISGAGGTRHGAGWDRAYEIKQGLTIELFKLQRSRKLPEDLEKRKYTSLHEKTAIPAAITLRLHLQPNNRADGQGDFWKRKKKNHSSAMSPWGSSPAPLPSLHACQQSLSPCSVGDDVFSPMLGLFPCRAASFWCWKCISCSRGKLDGRPKKGLNQVAQQQQQLWVPGISAG